MSNTTPRIYQDLLTLDCFCEYCGAEKRRVESHADFNQFVTQHRERCLPPAARRLVENTPAQKEALHVIAAGASDIQRRGLNINTCPLDEIIGEPRDAAILPPENWHPVSEKWKELLMAIREL